MKLCAVILATILALAVALGMLLARYSMRIQGLTLEQARARQSERYDPGWYDDLEKRDYTVKSCDGYSLHAQLLVNPRTTDRYVILSHGYTDNRIGSLKYARIYLDLGFNAVIYDLRGHGLNERTYCTYSVREARDLDALIRDARTRFPGLRVLGLHGESLGAATSVAVLKYRPEADFVVADCGFSEITSILKAGLRQMRLPAGLVYLASLCAKGMYGYMYSEMRPIDSLRENDVPVLFIHGDADSFIPPSHSEAMHAATRGMSALRLMPGARHAASVFTDYELYCRWIKDFLTEVGAI